VSDAVRAGPPSCRRGGGRDYTDGWSPEILPMGAKVTTTNHRIRT